MCPSDNEQLGGILECNLLESSPSPSSQLASPYPDSTAFGARSHPQHLQSKLFQLPVEIRRVIFLELWRSAGLSQHIFLQGGQYAHAPCLIEHDVDETQGYLEALGLNKSFENCLDGGANQRRLLSRWCNHWPCEEAVLRAQRRRGSRGFPNYSVSQMTSKLYSKPSPFLATLLTCKEMYLECSASIYSSVTFTFTSATTANDFLFTRSLPMGDRSLVQYIRNINLSCRIGLQQPGYYGYNGEPLKIWDTLVRSLATLARVESVHIWLDSANLDCNVLLGSNPRPFLSVDARLARILTVDFPVDEDHGIQWEVWPQEKFRMRPRACEMHEDIIDGCMLFD